MMRPGEAEMPAVEPKDRVIVALDVPTSGAALDIVREIGSNAGAYKVGMQLFTSVGPSIVRTITDAGHRIFLDLKFHDIPNTVAAAAVEAVRLGVWMLNVHALGGSEMMRRTADSVRETCFKENLKAPLLIGVTILTSSDRRTMSEVGIDPEVESEVDRLSDLAKRSGMDGVVASPLESARIRRNCGGDFVIVTPGVRPAFATKDDQKRVMTPREALAAGSDYLVIGRPITAGSNKIEALKLILGEIGGSDQ